MYTSDQHLYLPFSVLHVLILLAILTTQRSGTIITLISQMTNLGMKKLNSLTINTAVKRQSRIPVC